MFLRAVRCPDLVGERSALALLVLELAVSVRAGPEFAHHWVVIEFAARRLAVGTVTAGGLGRVLEGAASVLAVGPELAVLLALVGHPGGRRRMPANTFEVLASCTETANILNVDGRSWGRGG